MKYYIDIETIPLPKEQRLHSKPTAETCKYGNTKDPKKREAILASAIEDWEAGTKSALGADTGRIALVCIAQDHGEIVPIADEDERTLLGRVWNMLDDVTVANFDSIIGFNSNHFDIPFLIRRSLVLGIKVPHVIMEDVFKYKPSILVDVMDTWRLGDRQLYISLEKLASVFGVETLETDVKGADFFKHWAEDKDACIEYCKADVEATRDIAKKMGL